MKMAISFYTLKNEEEVLLKKIDLENYECVMQEVNDIVEIDGTLYKIKGRRNCYGNEEVETKYLIIENDKANWDLF